MPLFSRHARTYREKARLAITLSWVAGYVNVAIVAVCGVTVSHVTGNITTFGLHLANSMSGHETWLPALFLLHLPLGFLIGAMTAQVLLKLAERQRLWRPAAAPIALEAVLLAALSIAIRSFAGTDIGLLWLITSLGAIAMGLQNATITKISGSVIRTTHLTGVTTDLGTEIVDLIFWTHQRLRSAADGRWRRASWALARQHATARIFLLLAIFCSFLAGATGGAWIITHWPKASLWLPTLFLLLLLTTEAMRIIRIILR